MLQITSNFSKKFITNTTPTINLNYTLPKFTIDDDYKVLIDGKRPTVNLYSNIPYSLSNQDEFKSFFFINTQEKAMACDTMILFLKKMQADLADYKIYCDLKKIQYTKDDGWPMSLSGQSKMQVTDERLLFLRFYVNKEKKTVTVSLWH